MNELQQIYQQVFGRNDKVDELFAPYRICPLGAHVDHQHGLVTGFAIDKGIRFIFSPTSSGKIDVVSRNFEGRVIFNLHEPIKRKNNHWGDYLRGVVKVMQEDFYLEKGIQAVIKGELPISGLSSSAALLCGFVVCLSIVNHLSLSERQVIHYASMAEREYIGLNNGILDQSCVTLCEKNKLLFMDTATAAYQTLSFGFTSSPEHNYTLFCKHLPFKIGIFFSGVSRKLVDTSYNRRVDECHAAAWMIHAFEQCPKTPPGKSFLRDIPEEQFARWYHHLPPYLSRRAQHFFGECHRVRESLKYWKQGDIVGFGKLINESCHSSMWFYECGSEELIALSAICGQCDGIYGGRFAGAGFNGAYVALVDSSYEEEIRRVVRSRYLRRFPEHSNTFDIFFCDMADGIMTGRKRINDKRYGINHIGGRICHKDVPTDGALPQAIAATGA